ncbi:MAG: 4Fe-4S dicluster domain-containing protein [Deltaproteobacteria bacterium]|nr:4Fe-4S dicluster domain-containing protein [Deltaproteobacteria bacterium]
MTENREFKRIVILSFPPSISGSPVVSTLTLRYGLIFNILKANINPRQEGSMTLELSGTEENCAQGISYLQEKGIEVVPVAQRISRDDESCMHCGLCTSVCPTRALAVDLETRLVTFNVDRCSACGMCTRVCPVKAMHVESDSDI